MGFLAKLAKIGQDAEPGSSLTKDTEVPSGPTTVITTTEDSKEDNTRNDGPMLKPISAGVLKGRLVSAKYL